MAALLLCEHNFMQSLVRPEIEIQQTDFAFSGRQTSGDVNKSN